MKSSSKGEWCQLRVSFTWWKLLYLFFCVLRRERGTPELMPPDVIDRTTQGYKMIVTGVQGAMGLSHLCSRKRKAPRGVLNGIAEGSYAPKMTSFLWSQITLKVAKPLFQSIFCLNGLCMRELQHTSSKDVTRRANPTAPHASWTIGHVKNKWE